MEQVARMPDNVAPIRQPTDYYAARTAEGWVALSYQPKLVPTVGPFDTLAAAAEKAAQLKADDRLARQTWRTVLGCLLIIAGLALALALAGPPGAPPPAPKPPEHLR